MSNEEILKQFLENFDPSDCHIEEPYGLLTITVNSSVVTNVLAFFRNKVGFNFLTDLCGIHYPDKEKQLGVIYHLHNLQANVRIRIKTFISIENAHLPTAINLYAGANWMERETYDFFGIIFDGHPNLTRILNVEYLDYFPMRKEYPLEDPTREDKDNSFFGR